MMAKNNLFMFEIKIEEILVKLMKNKKIHFFSNLW